MPAFRRRTPARWWQFGLIGGAVLLVATAVKLVRALAAGATGEGGMGETVGFAALLFGMGFLCGLVVWAGKGLYNRIGLAGDAIVGAAVLVVFFLACTQMFAPEILAEKFVWSGVLMLGLAVALGAFGGAWTGRDVRKQLAARRRPSSVRSSPGPDLPEPRCCHYTFAHIALRLNCLTDPRSVLALLASSQTRPYLANVLRAVADGCRDREPQPDFTADDVVIHHLRIGAFPGVVFELPPARAVAEAHLAAMAVLGDPSATPQPEVRYFTLEKGMSLDGPRRTVLCEWTADGSHLNLGDGPEPTVIAFVAAITPHLSRVQE